VVRTEMFTPEVIARMPKQSKNQFIDPPVFTAAVLNALEKGKFEVTVPSYIGIAYVVRALLPSWHRRMTARIRLPVLPDLAS